MIAIKKNNKKLMHKEINLLIQEKKVIDLLFKTDRYSNRLLEESLINWFKSVKDKAIQKIKSIPDAVRNFINIVKNIFLNIKRTTPKNIFLTEENIIDCIGIKYDENSILKTYKEPSVDYIKNNVADASKNFYKKLNSSLINMISNFLGKSRENVVEATVENQIENYVLKISAVIISFCKNLKDSIINKKIAADSNVINQIDNFINLIDSDIVKYRIKNATKISELESNAKSILLKKNTTNENKENFYINNNLLTELFSSDKNFNYGLSAALLSSYFGSASLWFPGLGIGLGLGLPLFSNILRQRKIDSQAAEIIKKVENYMDAGEIRKAEAMVGLLSSLTGKGYKIVTGGAFNNISSDENELDVEKTAIKGRTDDVKKDIEKPIVNIPNITVGYIVTN